MNTPKLNQHQARPTATAVTVPADILMDVLNVLVSNAIRFTIVSVNIEQSRVNLSVMDATNESTVQDAMRNVSVMLDEYERLTVFLRH